MQKKNNNKKLLLSSHKRNVFVASTWFREKTSGMWERKCSPGFWLMCKCLFLLNCCIFTNPAEKSCWNNWLKESNRLQTLVADWEKSLQALQQTTSREVRQPSSEYVMVLFLLCNVFFVLWAYWHLKSIILLAATLSYADVRSFFFLSWANISYAKKCSIVLICPKRTCFFAVIADMEK